MIRMGRSSKNENTTPNETTEFQEQSETTSFQYPNETQATSTRAMSESESMARDIKEGRLSGFVGAGTVLTGETDFDSMLRIDGHLTGKVSSKRGTLVVGSTGQVDANVDVAAGMINGRVNGDIVVTEKLQLGKTARVVGNISAPRLIIEDGAVLEGNCSMVKPKEDKEQQALEQQAQFTTNELSNDIIEEDSTPNDDIANEIEEEDEDESADAASN